VFLVPVIALWVGVGVLSEEVTVSLIVCGLRHMGIVIDPYMERQLWDNRFHLGDENGQSQFGSVFMMFDNLYPQYGVTIDFEFEIAAQLVQLGE